MFIYHILVYNYILLREKYIRSGACVSTLQILKLLEEYVTSWKKIFNIIDKLTRCYWGDFMYVCYIHYYMPIYMYMYDGVVNKLNWKLKGGGASARDPINYMYINFVAYFR